MNLKNSFAISGLVLSMGMAQSTYAATSFSFDPTGGGSTTNKYSLIDQAPGNALAKGGVTAIQNFIAGAGSTEFTLAYQANLGLIQDTEFGVSPTITNGAGGNFFNFTMQFQEKVTSVAANNSATFGFVDSGTNIFEMFVSNAAGNDLTGAGFGVGTSILTAKVTSIPSSNYTNQSGNSSKLDNFFNDDWVGTGTRIGSGATDLRLEILSVDAGYFPDLDSLNLIEISFLNTSQVTPYNQANPSKNFQWLSGGYAPNVGAINGLNGPDFLFQADANQSIDKVQVPEPATLLMLGLGLAGMSRLRKQQAV